MSTTAHVRQHNSLLAAAEKRALIWIATQAAALDQFRSPFGARAGRDGGRRRVVRRCRDGSCCRRDTCGAVLAPQLVRRQPRRHGGARARPAAAALRLLRRSRDRSRRHGVAVCRTGGLGIHVADDCLARGGGVLPGVGGDLSWRHTPGECSRWRSSASARRSCASCWRPARSRSINTPTVDPFGVGPMRLWDHWRRHRRDRHGPDVRR